MNKLRGCLLCSLLIAISATAQKPADSGFRTLHVDASAVTGEIRSFQGLNGPPSPVMTGLPNLEKQNRDLRVNQVSHPRFHGPTGASVKLSNPLPVRSRIDRVAKRIASVKSLFASSHEAR